jgi:membrane-bound lytic murein transglycosylase F
VDVFMQFNIRLKIQLKIRLIISLILFTLLLTACSKEDSLNRILKKQELVVATRNAATTYYEDRDGKSGFEYDMVTAYANSLGVNVRFVITDSLTETLRLFQNGEVDLVASGITRTEERAKKYRFSVPYQEVQQQVVCRRKGKRIKNITELDQVELAVPANSSYVERLKEVQKEFPELRWHANPLLGTENLLTQVWQKKLECTIADSNIVDINRRYYPELVVRFNLTEPQPLAWVMSPEASSLNESVDQWMEQFKTSDQFAALYDKYYGFIEVFDFVDMRAFQRRINARLPKYLELFKQAAKKYNFDWRLLAAVSYQESHWRSNARSPTGVRGMMMLTLATAKDLGVKNRLNAKQSILGGARYLYQLRRRLPESILEPDRDWMTLAAYNVGMGHLYDARSLARKLGKNPDLWRDLATVLPLLSQKKYYKKLKYGYARGNEPVRYVQRIRDYQDILVKKFPKRKNVVFYDAE